jgi:hypothetical protein
MFGGSWDRAGACETLGGHIDFLLNQLLIRYFDLMWNFSTSSFSNLIAYLCIARVGTLAKIWFAN